MADNNPNEGSIFNVGDLVKPVDTLIQRTSDFLGAALAPRQLIRMAKAKVEADRIEKLGNVETEIRERALQRLLAEQVRNQENIENIVQKALPEVKENAKPEEISDDWLGLFFDNSKRFSDDEMQNLWAKILAGEANKAGTFSKRTIELISTLEKSDAELFTNLCSFNWHLLNTHIPEIRPLIYVKHFRYLDGIYRSKNITIENLIHLETIGLIKLDLANGFFAYAVANPLIASYYGTQIYVKFGTWIKKIFKLPPINQIEIGNVMLTNSGQQLATICGSEKVGGFLEYVSSKWYGSGVKISLSEIK